MLVAVLTHAAVIAYAATGALYGADLISEARTSRVGRIGYAAASVLTAVAVVAIAVEDGPAALLRGSGVFATLALVIGVGFLAIGRSFDVRVAAALVAPACAVLLVGSLLQPLRPSTPEEARLALVYIHVGLVLIGLGTFALAAVLAGLYLLQERQLKKRQFGALFHRLPSLEELDAASFRLVVLGFVIYTVALIVGFLWLFQSEGSGSMVRTVLSLVAWVMFASVIHTRVTSGWRGRQSAWMTIIGAVSALLVLAGYAR